MKLRSCLNQELGTRMIFPSGLVLSVSCCRVSVFVLRMLLTSKLNSKCLLMLYLIEPSRYPAAAFQTGSPTQQSDAVMRYRDR